MTSIIEQLESLSSVTIPRIALIDIIQIIILTFVIYYIVKSVYKTRAWILVKGLAIIGVVYVIICLTEMVLLQNIMQSLFSILMIAIVIMLQPELQKLVEIIGQNNFGNVKSLLSKKKEIDSWYSEKTIDEITQACASMSKSKTGALIVIEKGIPLEEYITSGIMLKSHISKQLLLNIFEKNTPLHDGAVIIKNNLVESATCYLPLTNSHDINKDLGTRHRAAIGASEHSDCIVVVVSEETGAISMCENGKILHKMTTEQLASELRKASIKSNELITKKNHRKTPLWLKIVCGIVSCVVWLTMTINIDPIISKRVDDVRVTTINTNVLSDQGQYYTIRSGNFVNVEVRGPRSLVDNITNEDIIASADFENISIAYSVPIDIKVASQFEGVNIISATEYMKLEIEALTSTEIPVEIKIEGDTNQEVVVVPAPLEKNKITVTCPQSIAKTLDKAVVIIDASNKTNNFIATAEPIIYDKNGSEVTARHITLDVESVNVFINVYEAKMIPVTLTLAEQDKNKAAYFELNGYTLANTEIKVAAAPEIFNEFTELNITINPDINAAVTKNVLIKLVPYLPEGVYLAKTQEDELEAELDLVKYQKKTIKLLPGDVQITNYDADKYTATVLSVATDLVLYYDTELITEDMLTVTTLLPTIQLTDNEVGTFTQLITLTEIDGVMYANNVSAKYELTKKGR